MANENSTYITKGESSRERQALVPLRKALLNPGCNAILSFQVRKDNLEREQAPRGLWKKIGEEAKFSR